MERFLDLPRRTTQKMELACGPGADLSRPTERLEQHGWTIVEPAVCAPDPWRYREYLSQSKGEWSVAKEGYVKSNSGWFSCRSACYLALGRPCVLQDTGWSRNYPTGKGLLAFRNMEEAVAGLAAVHADYAAHCAAARDVAVQMFDAPGVGRFAGTNCGLIQLHKLFGRPEFDEAEFLRGDVQQGGGEAFGALGAAV